MCCSLQNLIVFGNPISKVSVEDIWAGLQALLDVKPAACTRQQTRAMGRIEELWATMLRSEASAACEGQKDGVVGDLVGGKTVDSHWPCFPRQF